MQDELSNVRTALTPLDTAFDANAFVNAIFGGEATKFFKPHDADGRSQYVADKKQVFSILQSWVTEVRSLYTTQKRTMRSATTREKMLEAIFDVCFLENFPFIEVLGRFQDSPEWGLASVDGDYRFQLKRLSHIRTLLLRKWEEICEANDTLNHFWVWTTVDEMEGRAMPVVFAKYSHVMSENVGGKFHAEFIAIGCGNTVGLHFLDQKGEHHALLDEEVRQCLEGPSTLYENECFKPEHTLNWLVQYTAGKFSYRPRVVVSVEEYKKLCSLMS